MTGPVFGFGATVAVSFGASLLAISRASAQVVFNAINDNGYFTPFHSGNAGTVLYGDGGWIGSGSDDPATLGVIRLGLAVTGSPRPGTTDIIFSFTDGDPSGLVFGSGALLYSTVITNVKLPASLAKGAQLFELEIPLPNVQTTGGFNNIGWSIGLANYSYGGSFGFQVSSCVGQMVGFYTNNASFYDGNSWSLFSFGPDCGGVANYVAAIELASSNRCPADLDGNGSVDAADLALLLGEWGGGPGDADFDQSGIVDAADLAVLLGAWGPCS